MIPLSHIQQIGKGLARPEGVMATNDGTVYAADGRGQIARISPSGSTGFYGDVGGVPNGICLDASGNCIIANIGNGQVQNLSPDGSHGVLLTHAEGRRMPAPNFPFLDFSGRLWVSNSTENEDVNASLQNPKPDGCVVLMENGKSWIVASGLYFANGLTLDRKEEYLYVAETLQEDILRFKILPDGSLSRAEVFGPKPLCKLGYPDGIAFDEGQNLWITFPSRNAVGYLTPAGNLEMVIEDPERKVLQRPTNICFGGKDRRTAYLGSLDGRAIPCFEAPFPGMRLVHQKH
jgi:sugar lactone lactonase YvrE